MKNSFNVEVNFAYVPLKPYEWTKCSFISGLKALRINNSALKSILSFDVNIISKDKTLLLSDTRESIVVRLDDNGKVVGRSFLKFSKDLEIGEFTSNLKPTDLKIIVNDEKIKYDLTLNEEIQIKKFLINSIQKSCDENKSKYLYFLYFNNLDDYSKDKLIKSIKEEQGCKFYKLYDFLANK